MNRSSIIAILAVLVIACVAGFLFFGGSFGGDVIKVGSSEFKAPEGYHQGAPNKLGDASMSNGTNEIYLTELNGTDVNVHIKGYQDYIKTQNQTIKVSNMNIDNVDIYINPAMINTLTMSIIGLLKIIIPIMSTNGMITEIWTKQ